MLDHITILTTTGDRPSFNLTCQWIYQQSYLGKVDWLVLDDGAKPLNEDFALVRSKEGYTVQHFNYNPVKMQPLDAVKQGLLELMSVVHARSKAVFFMSDDAYYGPGWLEEGAHALAHPGQDIYGRAGARFFHLETGGERIQHHEHYCPLSSSAWTRGMCGRVTRALEHARSDRMDMTVWKDLGGRGTASMPPPYRVTYLGGLPGRPGWGPAEQKDGYTNHNPEILDEWLGPHIAGQYRALLEPPPVAATKAKVKPAHKEREEAK